MRKLLLMAGVIIAAAVTIGINRIVVTDGRIDAVALQAPAIDAHVATRRFQRGGCAVAEVRAGEIALNEPRRPAG